MQRENKVQVEVTSWDISGNWARELDELCWEQATAGRNEQLLPSSLLQKRTGSWEEMGEARCARAGDGLPVFKFLRMMLHASRVPGLWVTGNTEPMSRLPAAQHSWPALSSGPVSQQKLFTCSLEHLAFAGFPRAGCPPSEGHIQTTTLYNAVLGLSWGKPHEMEEKVVYLKKVLLYPGYCVFSCCTHTPAKVFSTQQLKMCSLSGLHDCQWIFITSNLNRDGNKQIACAMLWRLKGHRARPPWPWHAHGCLFWAVQQES